MCRNYSHIMRILGLNKTWNVVIVGAGKPDRHWLYKDLRIVGLTS